MKCCTVIVIGISVLDESSGDWRAVRCVSRIAILKYTRLYTLYPIQRYGRRRLFALRVRKGPAARRLFQLWMHVL